MPLSAFRELSYKDKVQLVRRTSDERIQEYVAMTQPKSLRYEMVRHNPQVTERILNLLIDSEDEDRRVRSEACAQLAQARRRQQPDAVQALLDVIAALPDPPADLARAAERTRAAFAPVPAISRW